MKINDLSPDLILTNGNFYTMDSHNSQAQAVAIKNGRFLGPLFQTLNSGASRPWPLLGRFRHVRTLPQMALQPGPRTEQDPEGEVEGNRRVVSGPIRNNCRE